MSDALLVTPLALLLALLVPLALARGRRRAPPAARFAPAALLAASPLPATWRTRLLGLPTVLAVAALLLLVVALARPVARVPLPRRAQGIDVLLCLDVSSSMGERDLDPARTRLELAKQAAARFVSGRPQDRMGLVTFARWPDVRCPLTLDHDALVRLIEEAGTVPPDGPEDATGLGAAVARAAGLLAGAEGLVPADGARGDARSKVVVLLTDGEENVATAASPGQVAPVHAAQLGARLGVRVITIAAGVGRRDREGRWVGLDTSALRDLAARTGGTFHEARDARAMAAVFETIDALETVTFEAPRHATEERFAPWVVAALVLLALGETLRRSALEVLP